MEQHYDPDLMAKLGNDHRKVRLLEWLCTAPELRDPQDQERLAVDEFGVTGRTVRNWKASQSFLRVWEAHARQVVGSPEKTQRLLDHLHETAMDSEHRQMTQAANTWLKAVGAIKPPEEGEKQSKSALADMSLEQLQGLAAQMVQKELNRREATV